MEKSIQLVIWIAVLLIALVALGFVVYGAVGTRVIGNTHPVATIDLQDYGTVKVELYPEYAPNTVTNFISLAEKGFYNGKTLWGKDEISMYFGRNEAGEEVKPRISNIRDDITDDIDYEYAIKGEFLANGFKENTMKAEKGTVLLIRDDYTQMVPELKEESYNSGKAQFAVIVGNQASQITGMYATFGKVIEGMEVLEKIYNEAPIKEAEATDASNSEGASNADASGVEQFANYPVISNITIDKKGIEFGVPSTIEAFDYQSYMYELINQYYGGQSVNY